MSPPEPKRLGVEAGLPGHEGDGRTGGRFEPRRALRRGWWALVAAPIAAIAAAAWITAGQTPLYRASASLAVGPSEQVTEATDALRSLETLERRTVVATFAEIASSGRALDAAGVALAESGLDLCQGGGVGCYRARGSVVPNTNVVRVEVRGPDPRVAAALADRVSAVTRAEGARFYPVFALRALSDARVPRTPVSPDLRRNLWVAGILGLSLGLVVTLGAEVRRSRSR